jgi:hypothetical protein
MILALPLSALGLLAMAFSLYLSSHFRLKSEATLEPNVTR